MLITSRHTYGNLSHQQRRHREQQPKVLTDITSNVTNRVTGLRVCLTPTPAF